METIKEKRNRLYREYYEKDIIPKKCKICGNKILIPAWIYCSDKCNSLANINYVENFLSRHPDYYSKWLKKRQEQKKLTKKLKDL